MRQLKVLTKAGHSLEEDRSAILECLDSRATSGRYSLSLSGVYHVSSPCASRTLMDESRLADTVMS